LLAELNPKTPTPAATSVMAAESPKAANSRTRMLEVFSLRAAKKEFMASNPPDNESAITKNHGDATAPP
jgi:hypothetical protein